MNELALNDMKRMQRLNHVAWRDQMIDKFPDVVGDRFINDTERMEEEFNK